MGSIIRHVEYARQNLKAVLGALSFFWYLLLKFNDGAVMTDLVVKDSLNRLLGAFECVEGSGESIQFDSNKQRNLCALHDVPFG